MLILKELAHRRALLDTVGVWGSNPHAPTIVFNNLAQFIAFRVTPNQSREISRFRLGSPQRSSVALSNQPKNLIQNCPTRRFWQATRPMSWTIRTLIYGIRRQILDDCPRKSWESKDLDSLYYSPPITQLPWRFFQAQKPKARFGSRL